MLLVVIFIISEFLWSEHGVFLVFMSITVFFFYMLSVYDKAKDNKENYYIFLSNLFIFSIYIVVYFSIIWGVLVL